jgi:hypothetical protein
MLRGNSRLWFYGIRCVLYFGIAWGALYWRRWRKRRREEIAQSWPSVEGTVQYTSVAPVFDNKHNQYYATLEYSYFVGEYRSGKYIQTFGDNSEAEANAFANATKDKKVQVLYNPSNPDKSDLDPSSIGYLLG